VIDSALLERRYRRLLAWYPRGFRRDHEDELLSVLLACAEDGRRSPGLAESADLIRAGMRMRLRAPRTAVRLMYAGALAELAVLITLVVSEDALKAAIVTRNPGFTAAQWHAEVQDQIVPLVVGSALAIGVWLGLAWAHARGQRWARFAFAAFFAVTTLSLLHGVSSHAATYARADLVAGVALWVVAFAAVALLFSPRRR
jgi:hypothetical protein